MAEERDLQYLIDLREESEKNVREMRWDLGIAVVGMVIFSALLKEGGYGTTSLIPSLGSLMVSMGGARVALMRTRRIADLGMEINRSISKVGKEAALRESVPDN